ncbi:DUF3575 domain-containing protein [Namhaeicola litoreus]|uniref:DUF3575 domain-containing protein n=1 Tax=Namhaeicola litoreus TaxID=1052145 RepID=A0ABW3XXU7_9FLAO
MKANQSTTLLFTLLTLPIFAQENIIKLGFLGSGGTLSGLQFERSITKQISFLGEIGYAEVIDILGVESNKGFGLYGEGRYYFSKNKDLMEGWHSGIYLYYLNTKGDDSSYSDYHVNAFSVGLNGGYQFIFSSHISLDLLAGGGIRFASGTFDSDTDFYPLLGLSLGYNF